MRAVPSGDRPFDIVSIGTRPEHTGLLKSVNEDGSWEGSVYVVPFHAHVDIETLAQAPSVDLSDQPLAVGPFDTMDAGQLVELSFEARSDDPGGGYVQLRTFHGDTELQSLALDHVGFEFSAKMYARIGKLYGALIDRMPNGRRIKAQVKAAAMKRAIDQKAIRSFIRAL